jgi:MOSC domain-containing protein YiiM
MQLLHVCIGKVHTHRINGQDVSTAYLKAPVDGPWRIELGGLEGNEIAVHTDPVYAYAQDSYDFWARRLGVGRSDWAPGTFAENLTFTTLAADSLRVGDIVELGPEVRLVVAGPRVPCFKLTWRLGQPESFIREFALSGHTGVYFGVLRPGVVTPGDQLRVVEHAPDNPTVTETARLIFGEEAPSEELLERTLALPTLSATAALALRARLYRTRDIVQTRRHRWSGWREFRVDDVRSESADTLSLRLRPADAGAVAGFRAGQFVTVRLPPEAGADVVRTWSCSDYDRQARAARRGVDLAARACPARPAP